MYMMDVILSIGIASSAIAEVWFIDVMKAYLGPEVMMPLASVVAGAVGFALIFWQRLTMMVRKTYRRLFSKKDADEVFEEASSLDTDSGD